MTSFKTSAIVALMTAAVGLSAIVPSYAQDAAPPTPPAAEESTAPGHGPMAGPRHDGQRQGGPRGLGSLIGFERGAEAVEIALVRLSHAVDMTAEQQALFDTLKTDAMAAADSFSSAIEALRPADGTQPQAFDIATGLDTRISIQTAQLEALKAVQPSLTAFFASLTDAQKAELAPARGRGEQGRMGEHGGRGEHGHGDHRGQHDGRGAGPMGGADDAAPAAPNNG